MSNDLTHIRTAPIGIFDSGLGGLSICKEVVDLLPNESIVYLADSKNAPYGEKSKEEIVSFCIKNVELLVSLGCKLIVVACNTATTNAIKLMREQFNVPIVGIEPATKSAALKTLTGKIGVLATKGTLSSELFLSTSSQFKNIEIIETEGKDLVRLIEAGKLYETTPLLEKYLVPMIKAGVDNIVLGCTHYPFLIPNILTIVPENVQIIDSGKAVAKQIKSVLLENDKLNTSDNSISLTYFSNLDENILVRFLEQINLNYTKVSFLDF